MANGTSTKDGDNGDGSVRKVADGYELRFERVFRAPIKDVWALLTEPERLEEWLGVAYVELRPGGRFQLLEVGGQGIAGVILVLEPPHVLEHTWNSAEWAGGTVRYELSEVEGGTRLVFMHIHPFKSWDVFRYKSLAGWHTLLDLLELAVEGRPESWHMERWQAHHDRYVASGALD
jgi:uncharacterized protein YndB with AHSA1/START domain